MKTFKKLYNNLSFDEKEKFLSLSPEEMLNYAGDKGCDTSIEEINSLLNRSAPFGNELTDEELNAVSGGLKIKRDDKCYRFSGNYNSESDYNRMYLCPDCGRIVHWGSWLRWYCDPCNQSWHEKSSQLLPNLNSGLWTSISQEEYDSRLTSINGR